jgi:hypothetical protein
MMKKILSVLVILMILVSLELKAQYKPFIFGFEISPNIGWMKPDHADYNNKGTDLGFSWGFISEFFLMENYAIVTGFDIAYVNSTMSYPHTVFNEADSTNISGTLERNYHLKYIQIPLVLKMKTRDFGKVRFFGKVGLGTSFVIGAKADENFTAPGNEGYSKEKSTSKDQVKCNREALILGVGLEYIIEGSTALFVGLNFDNGFTDVLKDQNTTDPEITHKAINNFIELSVGVVF